MDDSVLSLINTKLNWAGVTAFVVYLAHTTVMKWLEWRDKNAEIARQEKLTKAVEKMADGVSESNKLLLEMKVHQDKSADHLRELVQRSTGTMDRETSLRLIDKFFGDLSRDVVSIFTYSLENNGYAERPDFIRDRVKTQIAQSIESQRTALSYFKMGIELAPFFAVRKRENKERFVLADDLWEAVEYLYKSEASLVLRVEEMRLVTQNHIRDYLTRAKHSAANLPLEID